jgi:site-specific DNA-methyltransferase (adenine-specific)
MKTGFPDTYQGNYHPTVKPVALMKYLVKMVSREGHVVLDPFAGSGTTGMACEELGRHYILIDTEEGYCEISRSRIRAIPATLPFGAGK